MYQFIKSQLNNTEFEISYYHDKTLFKQFKYQASRSIKDESYYEITREMSEFLSEYFVSTWFIEKLINISKDYFDIMYNIGTQPLDINIIRKYKNILDWSSISRYYRLTYNFLKEFEDFINWDAIDYELNLTEDQYFEFRSHFSSINYLYVNMYNKINFTQMKFILENDKESVNWQQFSLSKHITEEIIEKYKGNIEIYYLLKNAYISDDLYNKLKNKVQYFSFYEKEV